MNGRKVFWFVFALFVFFFIVTAPDDAADIGHSIGHGIHNAFDSLSEFVKEL